MFKRFPREGAIALTCTATNLDLDRVGPGGPHPTSRCCFGVTLTFLLGACNWIFMAPNEGYPIHMLDRNPPSSSTPLEHVSRTGFWPYVSMGRRTTSPGFLLNSRNRHAMLAVTCMQLLLQVFGADWPGGGADYSVYQEWKNDEEQRLEMVTYQGIQGLQKCSLFT